MNKINIEKVIDYTKILKDNELLQEENKRLHSIIKEVREYINKNTINNTFYEEFNGEVKELLAILDKEK